MARTCFSWTFIFLAFLPQVLLALDVSTLRLMHIVFRHGDRTASNTYPSSEHPEDFWPQGFGQLTQLGMKQEYDFGTYLRSRYNTYLNSTYVRYELNMKSARPDRCLMSASCLLAGLYPPEGTQVWSENIMWQPIPVHSNDFDPVLDMNLACVKYDEELKALVEGPEGRKLFQDNQDLITKVLTLSGYEEMSLYNALDVSDPLLVESQWGIQPDWLTEEMLDQLEVLRIATYDMFYLTKSMVYLRAGLFMHEISNNTKSRMDDTMDKRMKLFLYSAHDTTIITILKALQTFDNNYPPYATAIIFELHQKPDGSHVVKVLHKNDTTTNLEGDPYELQLPGCAVECPVADFLQIIQPVVMEGDWDEECGNNSSSMGTGGFISVVAGIAVLLVILLGIIFWCGCKKRSPSREGYQPIASS